MLCRMEHSIDFLQEWYGITIDLDISNEYTDMVEQTHIITSNIEVCKLYIQRYKKNRVRVRDFFVVIMIL